MKVKHIIAFYLLGEIVIILGALFKILHWPYANELLMVSALVQPIAVLLAIWKVFTLDKFKEFLNS